MELKTKVTASETTQDLMVIRDFDLPVTMLFKAFTDAELFAQWMGTRVLVFDMQTLGSYRFETVNAEGQIVFRAHGCIHELESAKRIVRTFEMEQINFPAQLEFLDFESLGKDKSRLCMLIIFRSADHRNDLLKLPFAYGLNMAHDRLQNLFSTKK